MKNFPLLAFFLLFACTQKPTPSLTLNELKNEFFAASKYDKRITLLDVEYNEGELVGTIQNNKIKEEWITFLAKNEFEFEDRMQILAEKPSLVKNSIASMRSEPKHAAEMSTQYLMGQEITIIRRANEDWYYAQGEDGYLGYVNKGAITAIDEDWEAGEKRMIQANEAVATDAEGQTVSDLIFGNTVVKTATGYLLPDGRQVQIDEQAFAQSQKTDKIDRVLDRAFSLMGRPYLWGGTSVKAMDCSGFTRMAFLDADYMLGRDASLQVHEGEEVSLDMNDWQRGDLLFFGTLREDGSQKITHVAIHIENGRFIHCSQRVRVESVNAAHEDFNKQRKETLLRVKRIF